MAEEKKTAKKETPEEALARIMKEDEELVPIKLFKDSGKYKDDVSVTINGKTWLIQRGVVVDVPRNVAKVLEESDAQRGIAADYLDGLQKESSI